MNTRRISIIPIALVATALVVVAVSVGGLITPRTASGAEAPTARLQTILDVKRLAASGFAWVMAEGYDPRLSTAPSRDLITGAKWQGLGDSFSDQGSILQQAGGAALVPFRDAAPAFSRNILITRDNGQSPFQTEPHLAVNPKAISTAS